ncbi:MAG: PqqD family peptide modification chaperone [Candidatus Methanofastidiosia archaeon]
MLRKTLLFEEGKIRLSLREETGFSVLNINGAHILYLNETASEYVKYIMEEKPVEEIVKTMTKKYKVTREKIEKDYEKVYFNIIALASSIDLCPFSSLGIESVAPFSKEYDLKAPHRFDLAITYRCNNNCIHCYAASPRETAELGTEEWKKVIDITSKLSNAIVFTGGEPLLREDIVELVSYSKNLVTGLITNGRLLPKYMGDLEQVELDHVQITIEGFEEVHNKIVGANAWNETIDGIRKALDSSVFTLTNTTLMKYNYKDVEKFIHFLSSLGLERLAFNSIIYSGKAKKDYALSLEDSRITLEKIIKTCDELGLELVWYTPTKRCEIDPVEYGLGLKVCSAARINVTVEPNGDVIPCQSWFEPMGNILKDQWSSIWNSKMAKYIRNRKYMPEGCKECEKYWERECTAGCPLEVYCF